MTLNFILLPTMKTSFLVILTFLFFQPFVITTSSNVTCIQTERESLLLFKQSLTDSNHLLSTWTGLECCEWHRVGCDSRNGHVVKLDLRSSVSFEETVTNNHKKWLEGELNPSLQNLKHLRYLDLSMNNFSGNIPEFLGSFKSLEYLNFSRSGFSGKVPHHLGNLSRLQSLDFKNCFPYYDDQHRAFNYIRFIQVPIINDLGWVSSLSSLTYLDLSGITIGNHTDWLHPVNMLRSLLTLNLAWSNLNYIPTIKFANFTSLSSLDLSLNDINSTIPSWLSNLTGLMHLNLHANRIHGKVPEFVGSFNALTSIDLSYNSLFGVLSETHFTKLKNLTYLWLSINSLVLNFSSQWIPPFQLQIFEVGSCNIGPHFPNWLQTQTNLQSLDLSNSSVSDKIPEWFENILNHIDYLDLSNNKIGGKLPRVDFNSSKQMGYRTFKMKSNKFEGSLATFPSNVRILDLSDNLLSGHVPQTDETMNPSLKVVNLSNNRFTGSIPVRLCRAPSIQVLDLSQNRFTGRLPGCLGNLIWLQALDLSNNTITGSVPSSLGSLTKLKSLHLHNNRFEGNLPLSFKNLTGLVTMDVGNNYFVGSIPFWIGENLSSLRILNLVSNKFTGKIPLQLCQLNALQLLNLAQNNISGTIPPCFRNLSGMMITDPVDLGRYTVSHYIENIVASVKGTQLVYTKTIRFLTSLDLSSNNITGEIPDSLMNLVGLKNLNLSRNQLKGQIPVTIGNLSQIESLDLSMNMLSGWIPQSLTRLNFLSYLNLSFNHLSGPIPIGNQLQTLADPSIYAGNNELCGPAVSRSCKGNNSPHNHVGEHDGQDDDEGLWYYGGMGSGFFAGFVGLVCSLFFIKTSSWRLSYFNILESVYGWLTVLLLLNLARLRRKCFS